MNITEYIKNKDDIRLINLTNNKDIIEDLKLGNLSIVNKISKIHNQYFSGDCLVIIIIDSNMILDESIFKEIVGLNNILMLTIYDDDFIHNEIKCKDIMIAYGYKYFGNTSDDKAVVFIYDISKYKENPDWLNSDNWANPELWEK